MTPFFTDTVFHEQQSTMGAFVGRIVRRTGDDAMRELARRRTKLLSAGADDEPADAGSAEVAPPSRIVKHL
jgi:hypothetical protein